MHSKIAQTIMSSKRVMNALEIDMDVRVATMRPQLNVEDSRIDFPYSSQ